MIIGILAIFDFIYKYASMIIHLVAGVMIIIILIKVNNHLNSIFIKGKN